jgi:hypothetical protein
MSLTAAALTSTDPRYMNDAWMRRNTGAWTPHAGPDGQVQYNDPSWQERRYSFRDVLESVNPIQHLPVVGQMYREATGTQLHPIARMAAGIAGGPVGAASAFANMALEGATGRDVSGHVLDRLAGRRLEATQVANGSYVFRPAEGGAPQRIAAPDPAENLAAAPRGEPALEARRGVTAPMPAGVGDAAPQLAARTPRTRPTPTPVRPDEAAPEPAQAAAQASHGGIAIVGARIQETPAPTASQRVAAASPLETARAVTPAERALPGAGVPATPAQALAAQFPGAAPAAGRGRTVRDYLENAAARDIQAETPRMPVPPSTTQTQAQRQASFGFIRSAAAATLPREERAQANDAPQPTTPAQISAAAQAAGAMQIDRANLAATMMRNLERYRAVRREESNSADQDD